RRCPHDASRWLGAKTRYPAFSNASIRKRDCVAQPRRPCEKMITGRAIGDCRSPVHIVTDMPAIDTLYSDAAAEPAIATAIVKDATHPRVFALIRPLTRQFCNADCRRGGR